VRWGNMRGSDNVEDRESAGPAGGIGGGLKLGGAGLIAVVAISWFLGLNPLDVLVSLQDGDAPSVPTQSAPPPSTSAPGPRDEGKEIIAKVLGDTEDTWNAIFKRMGREYRPPKLVLFRGAVDSACGLASSAAGPFYCSSDDHVYLDRSFFEELSKRFGAPGDFARAYVIAHEVGHHVQNQLGITDKVAQQRGRASLARSNALSVLVELQADCFATSRPASRLLPPLGTIGSSSSHEAASRPSPLPTAPRRSECGGSAAGSTPVMSINATPSRPPGRETRSPPLVQGDIRSSHRWGGEGLVLKDWRAPYRPGLRSRRLLDRQIRHQASPSHWLTSAVLNSGHPEVLHRGRLQLRQGVELVRRIERIDVDRLASCVRHSLEHQDVRIEVALEFGQ
jgi:predicted metalloprotease